MLEGYYLPPQMPFIKSRRWMNRSEALSCRYRRNPQSFPCREPLTGARHALCILVMARHGSRRRTRISPESDDPFARLGIAPGASFEQVQAARERRRRKRGHPQAKAAKVEAAYDSVLTSRLRNASRVRSVPLPLPRPNGRSLGSRSATCRRVLYPFKPRLPSRRPPGGFPPPGRWSRAKGSSCAWCWGTGPGSVACVPRFQ